MDQELTQLREELARLKTASEHNARIIDQISQAANIGHWEVDLENSKVFWSKKTHELHGTDPATYTPNVTEGLAFYAPEHRPVITGHFEELTRTGAPFDLELIIIQRNSGEHRWMRVIGRAVFFESKVVKAYGTFQDIHQEKLNSHARNELDDKLRLILDSFNIGFWDWTIATDELRWNAPMFRLFGLEPATFTNDFNGWAHIVLPEDLERTSQELQVAIASGDRFNSSFRIKHSQLGVRHIRGSAIIIRDAQGAPIRLWGINYDVTQEHVVQEHLGMLESLVNASPEIYAIASPKGEILFLNQRARQFGWSEEKSLGEIFPVESIEKYLNEIFPVLREKGQWRGEVQFLDTNTGEEFPVRQHSFLLRTKDGHTNAVATIATDIRAERKLEAELERQRLQLVQASKMTSLGEMAGGVAHEINNPLAIIKGNVALLEVQCGEPHPDSEQMRRSLSVIDQTVDRIAAIIKALRSFAKDGSRDEPIDFHVAPVVDSTLAFFRNRIASSAVKLSFRTSRPELVINGRPAQISQALANLISNAFEAAKNSSTPEVTIEILDGAELIQIRVSDSGDGIPVHLRQKILEPFFTTREVGQGTGLGLPVAKGLVEANKGRLYLDTGAPRTTFVMEFPRVN